MTFHITDTPVKHHFRHAWIVTSSSQVYPKRPQAHGKKRKMSENIAGSQVNHLAIQNQHNQSISI